MEKIKLYVYFIQAFIQPYQDISETSGKLEYGLIIYDTVRFDDGIMVISKKIKVFVI